VTLAAGIRLGPYEILAPLGAGGMGEVYKARDTRLQREVAVKVLPEEISSDSERLRRFEQEAQAASALNHPNIVVVYDVGREGAVSYLAMELVSGTTLRDLLLAGPLSSRKVLSLAAQVSDGLAKAHAAGIVHRDLKPENVMVSDDGFVKILDFGLAKRASVPGGAVTSVPTAAFPATEVGTVLGTVGYMSPEQAAGRELNYRSDQFSFGSILYEMATGRRAFRGDSAAQTMAAIIEKEPPPVASLKPDLPAPLCWVIERCLAKPPGERYESTRDLARDLANLRDRALTASASLSVEAPPSAPSRKRSIAAVAAVGLLLALLAGAFVIRRSRTTKPQVALRFAVPLPSGSRLSTVGGQGLTFSPDGRTLVFRAAGDDGAQLYRRSLSEAAAVPIPGTRGGFSPFFSPDGNWMGFFTFGELRKVSLAGGTPITVCKVPPVTQGGSWGPDDVILFTPSLNSGLYRVSAGGGDPQALTTPEKSKGEHAHLWPQILPNGKAVLFTVRTGKDFQDIGRSNIVAQDLKSGRRRTLIEGSSYARYGPSGRMLFVRGAALFEIFFDAERLEVEGAPRKVVDEILTPVISGVGQFAASDDGTLVYALGGLEESASPMTLVWTDRDRKETPLSLPLQTYQDPRLAPGGERLVFMARSGNEEKIWIYDLGPGVLSLFTTEPGRQFNPVWSSDGKRIAYSQYETGLPRLSMRASDGSGEPELLTSEPKEAEFPSAWSPDGRLLAYTTFDAAGGSDIWLLSPGDVRSAHPWFTSPFREIGPTFSPDGRWIAYTSDESGRPEIFVRPFPGPGGKVKVSTDGGAEPLFFRDGRGLFYRSGERIMTVEVRTQPEFAAGSPRVLFEGRYLSGGQEDAPREYDVSLDGKRFLLIKPGEPEKPVTLLHGVADGFSERSSQ
jgi:serine/threonine protein kinase/Tol biopolymer transport system component